MSHAQFSFPKYSTITVSMANHPQLLRPDLAEPNVVEEAEQGGFSSHMGRRLRKRCHRAALSVELALRRNDFKGIRPRSGSVRLKRGSNSVTSPQGFRYKSEIRSPLQCNFRLDGSEAPRNNDRDQKSPACYISHVNDSTDHPLPWSPEKFSLISTALWERRSHQVDVGSYPGKENPLDLSDHIGQSTYQHSLLYQQLRKVQSSVFPLWATRSQKFCVLRKLTLSKRNPKRIA